MPRQATYKPLLFTTTLRSPSRLKGILNVLKNFNGLTLTNELAEEVMGEIIKLGLYRPMRGVTKEIERKWGAKRISDVSPIGTELLSDEEVEHLLQENIQDHKEAGFDASWPSRFATLFDFAKELGFVYYWIDEEINFSEVGLKLTESINIEVKDGQILFSDIHPEFEQQAFLNALAKYQRNNPFVRVLNDNVPLVLLLQVIDKLNKDEKNNSTGISKLELPLIIYWKDSDAEKLYQRIMKLREQYGYSPSWEVITEICRSEIMMGEDIERKNKSIMTEYPDEFIRKMRLTGLISLRGGGRFIDINKNEQVKVQYILENYTKYKKYSTEEEYFKYISSMDKNLILFETKKVSGTDKDKLLTKWISIYSWDTIKEEMLNLSDKKMSKDDTLKYLSEPTRLEFLTTLAVKSRFPQIRVFPNYPVDDEGLPTSTAGGVGNIGDIECFEDKKGVLIEVTMSAGRSQTMMEVWPIRRHLIEFSHKSENSMCYFIAPMVFIDSEMQIEYVRHADSLNIVAKSIREFLEYLETSASLYSIK